MNRDQAGAYRSKAYAREELAAEMAGAFVCAALDIVPIVRHADYLGEWLSLMREDSRAIFRAASAASKAADYLLAFRAQTEVQQPSASAHDANDQSEISPDTAEPER